MAKRDTPLDPLRFDGGSILLLPSGRCIVQLDELPPDAPDDQREYVNRYLATLAAMGHTAYVGDVADFAFVRHANATNLQ